MKLSRTGRIVAAAVTVPALLLSTGSAALAATNSLTLSAFNRNGTQITLWTNVVNVDTSMNYSVRTGVAKKLPKGTYVVLSQIGTGTTTTLAGYTVAVSGAKKLTIDARQGRRVGLGLNPAAPEGYIPQLNVRVCTLTGASYNVEAGGDDIYVVPTSSKKVGFAALGSWTDLTGTSESYAVLNQTTGVPASPARTYARSGLGTVYIESRRGPGGTNSSDIAVQPAGSGCGLNLFAELVSSDQPSLARLKLSPGTWDVRSDEFALARKSGESWDIGGYSAVRKVAAGGTYGARFYGSTWGPGALLPAFYQGRISYNLNDGFEDPYYPGHGSMEGGDKATAVLRLGSKVVAVKKDTGWMPETTFLDYKVKKAGWYTLTNASSRWYPEITYWPGMLSTASYATYRFPAKPKASGLAPVFAVQMIPGGLNLWNRAKPSSTTSVALKLSRFSFLGDVKPGKNPAIKSVTAQMSLDGRTWRSVPVRKVGANWTAIVTNPASGVVSLRARATTTAGAYTEVSVTRAYTVG